MTLDAYNGGCQPSTRDHVQQVTSFLQQHSAVVLPRVLPPHPHPTPASQGVKALFLPPHESRPGVPLWFWEFSAFSKEALSGSIC